MTCPRSIFLLIIIFFLTGTLCGQEDTIAVATSVKKDTVKLHDPKKAALLSLIPGAGQIYNKKWWKLPIIYVGLGAAGYFAVTNGLEAIKYRNEFFFHQHGATEYYNEKWKDYDIPYLISMKNDYLRTMEICVGVFTILYALNIIDALVDAHLFYFDVSDDLSLRIMPYINNNAPFKAFSAGITFGLSIR